MSPRGQATIYVDAMRAAQWILENVPPATPLGERVHHTVLEVCEQLALALDHALPHEALHLADEALVRLRVQLRLALNVAVLEENGFLHLSRELDLVGRQIGGWTKHLAQG